LISNQFTYDLQSLNVHLIKVIQRITMTSDICSEWLVRPIISKREKDA